MKYEKMNQKYSYKDYLIWPEDERWELIDGTAYAMSPAPSRRYQDILGSIFLSLGKYFEKKECFVYPCRGWALFQGCCLRRGGCT